MKKAKEFLQNLLLENEMNGEIQKIMSQYKESDFEKKVSIKQLDKLIEFLDSIVTVRKKLNRDFSKDAEAMEELNKLMLKKIASC